MENLEKVKELLLKRRNEKRVKRDNDKIEKDGFFDAIDAFTLGVDIGEAMLVEELIAILEM